MKYDWDKGRVTGVYEEDKVDLPLTAGVQDDASMQIAMMVELLRGRTPDRFTLLNKDAVRQYRYTREGEATPANPARQYRHHHLQAASAMAPRA